MGHRLPWCCGVGAVLAWSAGAHAEDIGHEPLAPRDGAAALSLRGPSVSGGAASGGSGGEALSPRGPAASAEHPQVDSGEYKPPRRWYGWQTLTIDGVALVTLVAVASRSHASDNPEAWLTGIAVGYSIAPPIVHLAHGHGGKAALSFVMRAVGPLLIAAAANDRNPALGVLGVLSIPAAISIDAAAVAREDVTPETSFLQRVGFAPWVDARRGAGGLMLDLRL